MNIYRGPDTWTRIFTVSNDGTRIVELEATPRYAGFQVRKPGLTKKGQPFLGAAWDPYRYERRFAATPQEAIDKFARLMERYIARAEADRAQAEACLARARQLAATIVPGCAT